MSYGVNQTWASQPGRAPAAAKRSARSTTTKRARKKSARSVPRARKKSTRKKSATVRTRAARAPKQPKKPRAKKVKKAKAPKLYKRYDPVDGHLEKVTRDDPRYDEWRRSKGTVASRKKALLKKDPLEYAKTFGADTVRKRASRAAETAVLRVGRKVAPLALAGASRVASVAVSLAPLAALSAAALAAILLQNRSVANARLALGDRINALSLAFVEQQKRLAAEHGVKTFGEVPAAPRAALLAGYKQALSQLVAATTVTQSAGKFGNITRSTIS